VTDPALSGAGLSRRFFAGLVAPLLREAAPGLRYAAARLGSGSDVLGLDDETSRDHDWGCRLTLLVDSSDQDQVAPLRRLLEDRLPERFAGFPVRFPVTWDRAESHNVEVATVADFAVSRLGVNPVRGLSALDWLTLTGQSVLEVTAGPVFADQTRDLAAVRQRLAAYPADVERYVLAAGWQRLGGLMPLTGRAAPAGDELGARLLGARLAAAMIALAFPLSRRWAPYAKWRGTAFRALPVAGRLGPLLAAAAGTTEMSVREDNVESACEVLLDAQRALGYPGPGSATAPFWSRPYRSVNPAVPQGLLGAITDPEVARLPPDLGAVGQWVDADAVLMSPGRRMDLQAAYRAWAVAQAAGPADSAAET
jgi:hypothetical protein